MFRGLLLFVLLWPGLALAQTRPPEVQAIIDRVEQGSISLNEAGDPGTDIWVGNSQVMLSVRNVTRARVTPVLPDPAKATGTAVVIVPGGGNYFVAHGNEGLPVADWLAARGIAAFVVTYRTVPAPVGAVGFYGKVARDGLSATIAGYDKPIPGEAEAREDVEAAIRLVRSRARDWGLNPRRIGALGFSAGAIAVLNTILTDDPRTRPAFAGLLYGRMIAVSPPLGAPPVFVAVAANDMVFGGQGFGLVDSWLAVGSSAELHYYAKGGHGFGMKQQGTTSDLWLEQFYAWLRASGF